MLTEDFKYYFADFVRKGGGGYPPNPKLLFGVPTFWGTPLTDKIRKVVFEVAPNLMGKNYFQENFTFSQD